MSSQLPDIDKITQFLTACQIVDGPLSGGIQDGYHLNKQSYDFIYSETTGYAIIYFLNHYRWTGNDQFLHYAVLAADFLINHLTKNGLPYNFAIAGSEPDRRYFVFDNLFFCDFGWVI